MAHSRLLLWLLAIVTVVLIWSGIHPHDYFTWLLEVAPVLIGVPVVAVLRKRLPFTPLVYVLIAIHMIILMVGGHYTYARVPPFDWLRDTFDLTRNHYDRVGHFAQGFIPAMIAREVLLRTTSLERGKMLVFLVLSIALAISGAYELIEWAGAELFGSASDDFLGTQGDVWDTQKDMALALIGAATALATLSGWHDRQLAA
jgi:putative membrane protein